MKLNRETRDLVKVGTKIQLYNAIVTVLTVIEYRNGKAITVQWPDKRILYAEKLSNFYGCEIIEEEA